MVRAICHFTKDNAVLPLEDMIKRITSQPAKLYSLTGKGEIRDGYDADLVLFDYEKLKDNATYADPTALAGGIDYVFVAGELACHDGALTGALPGRLLRHRA
jgi:N-acyl-D-amino-acid deacylase